MEEKLIAVLEVKGKEEEARLRMQECITAFLTLQNAQAEVKLRKRTAQLLLFPANSA